jgi:hypothetical protein
MDVGVGRDLARTEATLLGLALLLLSLDTHRPSFLGNP